MATPRAGFEDYVVKGGPFACGSYPDIAALYQQQAVELNRKKREAILHKMQQLVYERTMFAPIWQLAFVNGIGPWVGESGIKCDLHHTSSGTPGLLYGRGRRVGSFGSSWSIHTRNAGTIISPRPNVSCMPFR